MLIFRSTISLLLNWAMKVSNREVSGTVRKQFQIDYLNIKNIHNFVFSKFIHTQNSSCDVAESSPVLIALSHNAFSANPFSLVSQHTDTNKNFKRVNELGCQTKNELKRIHMFKVK